MKFKALKIVAFIGWSIFYTVFIQLFVTTSKLDLHWLLAGLNTWAEFLTTGLGFAYLYKIYTSTCEAEIKASLKGIPGGLVVVLLIFCGFALIIFNRFEYGAIFGYLVILGALLISIPLGRSIEPNPSAKVHNKALQADS